MLDYKLPDQTNAKCKHCNVFFYKHVSSNEVMFMHTPRQAQKRSVSSREFTNNNNLQINLSKFPSSTS
jgi:hypothetical protein